MALRISGKNMDIGNALMGHVEDRMQQTVGKYFDGRFTGHVTVEREGSGFKTDCAVHLDTGIVLQAEGTSQAAQQSFDIAAEHIEKRLRRYKRRLKEHHHGRRGDSEPAASYVIEAPDAEADVEPDYAPIIIAEEATVLPTMTVGNAVVEMDLSQVSAVVFRNAGHGGINFVYRRRDGNIGWVDPSLAMQSEGESK